MNGIQHSSAGASVPNGARPSMSASPSALQGTPPTGQNGQPHPKVRRRRPQTDPLRPAQRPLKKIARSVVPMTTLNASSALIDAQKPINHQTATASAAGSLQEFTAQGATVIPLVTTPRAIREGLRHHVMRLQQSRQAKENKQHIDIFNESQFVRPIRLHRRDPRAPPSGAGAPIIEEETKDNIEEDKERERQEIAKEERRRIREENQAKIAPSTTKKPPAFQRKTEQIYRPDDTPEAQKRSKLRYEEALPWHLEDFDNKQTWVGSYESEMSETHVMLLLESGPNGGLAPAGTVDAKARMVPLEKWYRFVAKGKGKAYTADEADKFWQTTGKLPKFIEKAEQMAIKREREESARRTGPGKMRTRIAGRDDDEVKARRGDDDVPIKREVDADDIDFNMEEDFADDEEGLNGLFEGDEAETKDAEDRLKRDQLAARVFDLRDEQEVYRQEEEEREAAKMQKQLEKSIRKNLKKREKNYDYDSSDSNPYSSSSESETDSETERQREKERKEEEERKAAEQNGKTVDGEKIASGASTKGTTTPSGAQKPSEPSKSKKRPGSPNLSEVSGNESSRKKHKKKHGEVRPDGSRKSSLVRLPLDPTKLNDISRRGAASGSESEMTDTGRKKKQILKLKAGRSPGGTPGGSRAGSPDAGGATGSRAGSPLSAGASAASRGGFSSVPTPEEIYQALPPEGILIGDLVAKFNKKIGGRARFTAIVKKVSNFDQDTRLITPKKPEEVAPPKDIEDAIQKAEAKAAAIAAAKAKANAQA